MERENSNWKLEKLLSDSSFRDWVCFNKNAEKWEYWTLEDKERAKLVDEARLILQSLKGKNNTITEEEIEYALTKTWDKINTQGESKTITLFSKKLVYISAAAVVFFLGLFYWEIIVPNNRINIKSAYNDFQNNEGLIDHYNNSNKALLITLSDGSSVLLQPKSRLSYPKSFTGKQRTVYLSGEAFFEISKDPSKIFSVYANEIITKVYGTSFRVVAYDEQPNVEVLVRTGKVKVSSNESMIGNVKNEVLLLPNQAARFVKKDLTLEKIEDITQTDLLTSQPSTIEKLSFEFKDIAVSQIFKSIEQAYLVNIDYPKEVMENCYLTTSLSDLTLSEKLKIVCESIGFNTTYVINGNNIKISSTGCN